MQPFNDLQSKLSFQMGRQRSDPTMVGSSIALLQERFRQLERVREKREEQELLKLVSESERVTPALRFEPGKFSFKPEMISPLSPSSQDAVLSLGIESPPGKPADFRAVRTGPSLTNFRSIDATVMSTSPIYIENSEVDTSLHL